MQTRNVVGVLLAMGLAVGPPTWAEDAEPKDEEAARKAASAEARRADTEEALELLQRSLDFLTAQQKFSFIASTGHDVLQSNGQKLEFGGRRRMLVRRPDRMRVDLKRRGGENVSLYFDGRQIAFDLPDDNAYVAVEKSGTLDEAIDYLDDDLREPTPLLDLIDTRLYSDLEKKVRYGLWVGEERLGDRLCDHLAFQGDTVDFQIWIEQGDRPLFVRLLITYKQEPGSPQFWADWTHWDLDPDVDDGHFAYSPAEGVERIPFAPRPERRAENR